jgi:hypothetical protein
VIRRLVRRVVAWLFPEDRVSPATLRRLRARADAEARLPPIGTAGIYPRPAPEPKPARSATGAYRNEVSR